MTILEKLAQKQTLVSRLRQAFSKKKKPSLEARLEARAAQNKKESARLLAEDKRYKDTAKRYQAVAGRAEKGELTVKELAKIFNK